MLNLSTKFKALLTLTLAALSTASYAESVAGTEIPAPIEGKDYIKLDLPASTKQKSVDEFLALWCHHCYDFHTKYYVEKPIQAMIDKIPGAKFTQYHILFGDKDITNLNLAKFWAALSLKNVDNTILTSAFDFVQDQVTVGVKAFQDPNVYQEWLANKLQMSKSEVESLWNSLKLKTTIKRYQDLSNKYDITQTPTFIVNGHYVLKLEGLANLQFNQPLNEILGDVLAVRLKQIMDLDK